MCYCVNPRIEIRVDWVDQYSGVLLGKKTIMVVGGSWYNVIHELQDFGESGKYTYSILEISRA